MRIKPFLVLCFVVLVVAGGFYWFYQTAFISVSVSSGKTGSNYTYTLTNQATNKSTSTTTSENSFKKRLAQGNYQLSVSSGTSTYFEVVKTGKFGKTTEVAASLQPEKSRKFVGDNPDACMNYVGNQLISYGCGDAYGNVKIHAPATATQPTSTTKNSKNTSASGSIEGIVDASFGTVALLHPGSSGEEASSQTAFIINNDLSPKNKITLKGLSPDEAYQVRAYKTGFIAYPATQDKAYYYAALDSSPQIITLAKPSDSGLIPTFLDAQGDAIISVFTTSADTKANKSKTAVIVTQNNTSKQFSFKTAVSSAQLCGTQKLCVVDSKKMSVYDISGSSQKYLYGVNSVISALNSEHGFLVLSEKAIINFDVDKRSGFNEYTLGNYTFSNLQPTKEGYVLAVTNQEGRKVALLVNQGTTGTDSIDQKVNELAGMDEIKVVSAFGNFIFITPNLGDHITYNPSLRVFDYDPVAKKKANDAINTKIDKLGIDRAKYTIVNTAGN